MKRDIVWTTQFKKDYKLACKRNLVIYLKSESIFKTYFPLCFMT